MLMDRIRKDGGHPEHAIRNPASAAKLLAQMRGAEPLTALNELSDWLDTVNRMPSQDERVRSEVLSLIQEASHPHLCALLAPFLTQPANPQAVHEENWKT